MDGLEQTLGLLFAESERVRCGQRLLADRLFDVLVLQLLRWLLDHPAEAALPTGMLTGLSDPKLARALTAIHEQPGFAWSLAAMAEAAGMSRSAFAVAFKPHVGHTPVEYLTQWRIAIAQALLRDGVSLKTASLQLGYRNASSLSRVFTQSVGVSPRAWLQTQ